jgi:NagD protein
VTTFIFDLDGTIHRSGKVIPGVVAAVRQLAAAGHQITFATNDSTVTRADQARWLAGIGIVTSTELVATAGAAAAQVLAESGCRSAFVLGPPAITAELQAAIPGIEFRAEGCDVVVVGLDPDLSYRKLCLAHQAVQDGARLVATNADPNYPTRDGRTAPGAGSVVAAVERSTGVTAEVVGKPSPALFLPLLAATGATAEEVVVVGDSPSDLLAAAALGARTVLTLTGVVSEPGDLVADLVVASVAELPAALTAAAAR